MLLLVFTTSGYGNNIIRLYTHIIYFNVIIICNIKWFVYTYTYVICMQFEKYLPAFFYIL